MTELYAAFKSYSPEVAFFKVPFDSTYLLQAVSGRFLSEIIESIMIGYHLPCISVP